MTGWIIVVSPMHNLKRLHVALVVTAGYETDCGNLVELLATNVRLQGYYLLIRPDLIRHPLTLRFRGWIEEHIRCDERSSAQRSDF